MMNIHVGNEESDSEQDEADKQPSWFRPKQVNLSKTIIKDTLRDFCIINN